MLVGPSPDCNSSIVGLGRRAHNVMTLGGYWVLGDDMLYICASLLDNQHPIRMLSHEIILYFSTNTREYAKRE